MGINPRWQEDVLVELKQLNNTAHFISHHTYKIIETSAKLFFHLVPLDNDFLPNHLIILQENYQLEGKLLVHLWEDTWLHHKVGVLSRSKSFLGLNQTLHARKAVLIETDSVTAAKFFNATHLQGFVKAKYYYGLMVNNELIAMSSFSDLRQMKLKSATYTSAELVRFASKEGYTITGGLSKLIKHFLKAKQPNDLMSYADRDWSLGKGYEQMGFELTAITAPSYLYVALDSLKRYFPHRLPKTILSSFELQKELNLEDYLANNGFKKVFNTGNLKYHLYV